PKVVIEGGGGDDADAVAVVSEGEVTEVIITRPGHSFTSIPTITFESSSGSGAVATATLIDPMTVSSDLTGEDISSPEAFRLAVQRERMLEFAGENLRRQDLIRWGNFLQNIRLAAKDIREHASDSRKFTTQTGDNVSERDLLLPIPSYDRNLNKLLTQNPGW